jgi:hypothetical protein
VLVAGPENTIQASLITAIQADDSFKLDEEQPDIIVEMLSDEVAIHNATGRRLRTITMGNNVIPDVMKALTSSYIVRQLAALENPTAPFAVDLWIEEPGITQFTTHDKVTLYYRVNGLPEGENAYLTLLNVAPDGTVAILYPQKKDFYQGPGTKLFLNAEVQTGQVYSIPKTQQALKPGQNVAVDLRIRLAEGQEYFKAIVTSEPIDWQHLEIDEFRVSFQGETAHGFVVETIKNTKASLSWGTGSLRVEVKKEDLR